MCADFCKKFHESKQELNIFDRRSKFEIKTNRRTHREVLKIISKSFNLILEHRPFQIRNWFIIAGVYPDGQMPTDDSVGMENHANC